MNVEAIIVCRDYSDFLEHTLPENIDHLDDIVVVTSHEDKRTQEICNKLSVHYVCTDAFTAKGHDFNKGLAINAGIDNLRGGGWLLHIDADIVLCKDFRRMLEHAQLNPKNIYGADRINVYGYEAWINLKPHLSRHYKDRWFIDPGFCHESEVPPNLKLGARVIHKELGYVPIGYFQLWHSAAARRYNFKRGSAAGTDIQFPTQWPRENRVLLPDVVCYHLDSETDPAKHAIGKNWKGRKSARFEPKDTPEAYHSPEYCYRCGHHNWPHCKGEHCHCHGYGGHHEGHCHEHHCHHHPHHKHHHK